MYNRLLKSGEWPKYREWLENNNYSIISSKHRGYYAEMVFRKFCLAENIVFVKINPHLGILEQIPTNFLKKIQQKELQKAGKSSFSFFCAEEGKGYFVAVKMGTSSLTAEQKKYAEAMNRNKAFLFRFLYKWLYNLPSCNIKRNQNF